MTLPTNIVDREYQKFEDISPGQTAVRVSGSNFSGSFTTSGLKTAGKMTEVTLNSSTWTALPPTALTARNAIGIQNYSGIEIKINYSSSVVGYVGIVIPDKSDRFYDITDAIIVYGKSVSGTPTINVEELS